MLEDLGKPIAYGRTAEIYAWHSGQVLKLFYDWFSLENIEIEARNTRAVHASGLPAPAVGQIIQVNGRYGLEYERLYGDSLFKAFQRKPWNVLRYGHRMAELYAMVHTHAVPAGLPSQRDRLQKDIRRAQALSAPLRSKVLSALDELPGGHCLCHGDFSPANILMTSQGEIVIDWFRAAYGNPLADLARTTNLVFGYTRTRQARRPFLTFGSTKSNQVENVLFQFFCRLCYPRYLDYYFELCPGDKEEYHRWLPIVAAARLADAIPELEKMLLVQVERNI
jgi:hypothetical protein